MNKHAVKLRDHDKLHELHNRRHEDQQVLLGGHGAQLRAQAVMIETIQANTQVQQDILKALTLLGKFSKWVLAVAGACGAIVALVKGVKL